LVPVASWVPSPCPANPLGDKGFTANDCLDIGIELSSCVSLDYYDKAPFKFNGTIEQVHVQYVAAK
jgi:hypothetical protein